MLANRKNKLWPRRNKRRSANVSSRRSCVMKPRRRRGSPRNKSVNKKELNVRMRKKESALKKRRSDWLLKMNA